VASCNPCLPIQKPWCFRPSLRFASSAGTIPKLCSCCRKGKGVTNTLKCGSGRTPTAPPRRTERRRHVLTIGSAPLNWADRRFSYGLPKIVSLESEAAVADGRPLWTGPTKVNFGLHFGCVFLYEDPEDDFNGKECYNVTQTHAAVTCLFPAGIGANIKYPEDLFSQMVDRTCPGGTCAPGEGFSYYPPRVQQMRVNYADPYIRSLGVGEAISTEDYAVNAAIVQNAGSKRKRKRNAWRLLPTADGGGPELRRRRADCVFARRRERCFP
jgi:hypothetical protein